MPRAHHRIHRSLAAAGLLAVLSAGAALRGLDLTLPWSATLEGRGGAFYSVMGRNHVRYGVTATRLALITCAGERSPGELRNHQYLNHPPFIGLMLAAGFALLGVHEWSARLGPLLASLLSIWALYRLLHPAGTAVALAAAAFLAALPMEATYGTFVDVLGPQLLLAGLLLFALYRRWHETRSRRHFLALFAFFLLATTLDWPVYLFPPLFCLHHLLAPGPRGRSPLLFLLLGGALLAFAGHLVWLGWLSGGSLGGLLHAFWVEHNLGVPIAAWTPPLWATWRRLVAGHLLTLYTAPVLILAGLGLLWLLGRALRRRIPKGADLSLIFLGAGFGYVLLFPAGSALHEYMSRLAAPGLCALAALTLRAWLRPRPVFLLATWGLAAFLALRSWELHRARHTERDRFYPAAGREIRARTDPAARLLVVGLPGEGPFYAYYGDRLVHMMEPEEAAARLREGLPPQLPPALQADWLVVPRNPAAHPLAAIRAQAARLEELGRACRTFSPPEAGETVWLFRLHL